MRQIDKFTIPLAALALVAAGAISTFALQSYAQTTTTDISTAQSIREDRGNSFNSLVKAIASKFNLSESDVQQVFDDQRDLMEAERKELEANRLRQAVSDGKLTQDQADKIIAKRAELETQREANKVNFDSMTKIERRAAMEAKRAALKQWAIDNNIPQQYIDFDGGHGPGGHRGF